MWSSIFGETHWYCLLGVYVIDPVWQSSLLALEHDSFLDNTKVHRSNRKALFFEYIQRSGSLVYRPIALWPRASNSPALRGSLPPGHYFSRQACKISRINEKKSSQACKISHISGEKTFKNNSLANIHRQRGMQPKKKSPWS